MEKRVPMTARGHKKLQEELNTLKTVERPQVIRAIADARRHGDLSENAEYHAAKENQRFIENRISEIEKKLLNAEVIQTAQFSGDNIVFGAVVTLMDEDTDKTTTYNIVGEDEADIKNGFLSINSPLARSLVGKKSGDSCEVRTPGGAKSYEILNVSYA